MQKQPSKSHTPKNTAQDNAEKGERIAKFLARAGVASRRDCEKLIEQGIVTIDGKTLTTPAFKVHPGMDVRVDGTRIGKKQPLRIWRYHKPAGLVTTHKDPEGRRTVFDVLDGLRAYGRVKQSQLDALKDGVTVEGIEYGPIRAQIDSTQGGNVWLSMSINEGKNREIRNICRHLDLHVNRLIRTAYGPFQLGKLAKDQFEEIPKKQLVEQLGKKLASEIEVG